MRTYQSLTSYNGSFASTSNSASLPTALIGRGVTIVDTTTSCPIPAKAVASIPVQYPAHGGDSCTPHGLRLSASAGAPVGSLRPKAAALLHAD